MKSNGAAIFKSLRKQMGLSQEEMAERMFISVRQLARIESGEAGLDVWQFINALELLGSPTEDFWLLYLDSDDYMAYREYKRLKRRLSGDDPAESARIISVIEGSALIRQPVVNQFVQYAKIALELQAQRKAMADIPYDTVMARLLCVIRLSKPGFLEADIAQYRMSYNEILLAILLAQCLSATGAHDRAITIIRAMIQSREGAKVSEDDLATLFPPLYYTLSNLLSTAGKHREALKACENAIEVCREYNNMKPIIDMLRTMAWCYFKLGEEEQIYKTHLQRAYHMAYAIGRNEAAASIKADALLYYGITLP